ncbi:hypothetical protein CWC17_19225, partial [Pseudoalteromonas sp. S3785]
FAVLPMQVDAHIRAGVGPEDVDADAGQPVLGAELLEGLFHQAALRFAIAIASQASDDVAKGMPSAVISCSASVMARTRAVYLLSVVARLVRQAET